MKFRSIFASALILSVMGLTRALADAQPTPDPAAKAEADYQKYLKDRHGAMKAEHDKFKNQTTLSLEYYMSLHDLEFQKPKGGGTKLHMTIIGVIPDKITKKEGPQFALEIIAPGDKGWRYLDCKELNWLVDGKPFKWQDQDYDNSVLDSGSTMEYFRIYLTPKMLAKLAKAQTIEGKICNDEFVSNQKQMWVLRWANEQIEAISKANTATK
ncbi:MAG TPA: hypothetical protein VHE12_00155 [bacterium]|nr:hypothetical protein [bacterium]